MENWVTDSKPRKTRYEPLIFDMSPLDWFFMLVTKRVNFESITEIIFSCSCFYNESYQYVWSHYLSLLSFHWKRKYDFKMKKRITSSTKYTVIFLNFFSLKKNLLFKVNQHAENLPLPAWCFTDGKTSIQRIQHPAQGKYK